jgi:hypothetical protein
MVGHGYQALPDDDLAGLVDWAFFPLFPWVARMLGGATGLAAAPALIVTSNLCMLGALFLLSAYCRRTRDRRFATHVVVLAAFSPFGIYSALGYTEGLFMLLTVGAFLLWNDEHYLSAGIFGALASCSRSVGVLLGLAFLMSSPVFRLVARRGAAGHDEAARILLGLALVPLGLAGFMAFLYALTGDPLAFAHAQISWSNPERGFGGLVHDLRTFDLVAVLGTVAVLIAGVLSGYLIVTGHVMEGVFLLAAGFLIILPRLALGEGAYSAPRYVFGCFPVYIALAALLARFKVPRWVYLPPTIAIQSLYVWDWVRGDGFLI